MSELRRKVCAELEVYNHKFLLVQGDHCYSPEEDDRLLLDLDIKEGVQLSLVIMAFARGLTGRWEPAPEDHSAWMTGMTIAADGTFVTKRGELTDGLVRVLSASERRVNLKRTCADSNDHVFMVEDDGLVMRGSCIQSGSTYTLTKQQD
uniref:Uncharacterized protein n=1 Tax=Spumella elongata TaxID=89044 RepID=A0A7S3HFP9_9STRA|mmetsp:Transcript_50157/g.87556  ORF Transcript_50157/g.87556 Transcript_50157/m.87556 type:complete len:149 (+) Transcript_50157:3-449(+)